MNFHGRMKHYRPSRYRPHKRPIDRRVLIIAGAAGAILLFSILLGAWLNSRVDESTDTSDTSDTQTEPAPERTGYDAYPRIETEGVGAGIIARSSYSSDSNLDKALARATEAGAEALCIELTNTDGIPRFTSSVYTDVLSGSSGKADLGRFITKAEMSGIEVRAQIALRSQSEQRQDLRDLRLSLEIALIAEAYEAGVREILLSGTEELALSSQYAIVRRIRESCPELAVGSVLKLTAEEAEDVILLAELNDIFDFIALDLTEALAADCADKKAEIPEGEGELERIAGQYVYAFTRYKARVFLRAGDGCSHCTGYAAEALGRIGAGGYYFITSDKLHE